MPEDVLTLLKENIKKETKLAFFSAIIIGFMTHMFVFTNMLPNHDGIMNIYHSQKKYYSGRFFLSEISGISSYFDLPWINGSLSILFLSLGATTLVELFNLRKSISIILTSGLLVTFPTVASTFSYMFTANGYMAAFTLSILAVFITNKYKYGFILGAFLIFISVGVYQINLPMVLALVIVYLIITLLCNRLPLRNIYHSAVKYFISIFIGMGLYTILFKTYQAKTNQLTNYQGLNNVGFPTEGFFSRFTSIVNGASHFFFRGFRSDEPINLFEILNVILFILIFVGLVIFIFKNQLYTTKIRLLMLILCLSFLPIAVYSLYFTSPGVKYHMLMQMPLVFFYLIPILLYDKLDTVSTITKSYSWMTVIITMLIIFNFAIISNITYFNMTLRYEKMYGISNRVYDRIEQTEGYENATKIAMIGKIKMDSILASEIIPNKIPDMTGANNQVFISDSGRLSKMLDTYLGKSIKPVSEKDLQRLKEMPEVKAMESWPARNSVTIIDDIIIVKFNE